jgi:hypothetical protein
MRRKVEEIYKEFRKIYREWREGRKIKVLVKMIDREMKRLGLV